MRTIAWVGVALALGAVLVLVPFWAPLLLAAWTAQLVQRPHRWLGARLGDRHRGAAAVTVLLLLVILIPIVIAIVTLSDDAVELAKKALASGSTSSALRTVVSSGSGQPVNTEELVNFAQKQGPGVWQVAEALLGALVAVVLGMFVFLFGVYELLVDGPRIRRWIHAHSPLKTEHLERLGDAFQETGRGLFIGVGLTALAQGLTATIAYFALGIPQAAVLGLCTCVAALVPSFGAALIWVPVTAGLALTGRPGAAVVMGLVGIFVSTADNFLRPVLSRHGKLNMSTFLLLLGMLGGMAIFGTWGLVLGPLLVRLALEGCRILEQERLIGPEREAPRPVD
jgi:predicted PurR-regulated permease PerM